MTYGLSKQNLSRLVSRLEDRYREAGIPTESVWSTTLTFPDTFLIKITETRSQKKLVISVHNAYRTLNELDRLKMGNEKFREKQIMLILADTPLRFDQDLETYIKEHYLTQWIEFLEFMPDRTQ
jgi:hypothetical protein